MYDCDNIHSRGLLILRCFSSFSHTTCIFIACYYVFLMELSTPLQKGEINIFKLRSLTPKPANSVKVALILGVVLLFTVAEDT